MVVEIACLSLSFFQCCNHLRALRIIICLCLVLVLQMLYFNFPFEKGVDGKSELDNGRLFFTNWRNLAFSNSDILVCCRTSVNFTKWWQLLLMCTRKEPEFIINNVLFTLAFALSWYTIIDSSTIFNNFIRSFIHKSKDLYHDDSIW